MVFICLQDESVKSVSDREHLGIETICAILCNIGGGGEEGEEGRRGRGGGRRGEGEGRGGGGGEGRREGGGGEGRRGGGGGGEEGGRGRAVASRARAGPGAAQFMGPRRGYRIS